VKTNGFYGGEIGMPSGFCIAARGLHTAWNLVVFLGFVLYLKDVEDEDWFWYLFHPSVCLFLLAIVFECYPRPLVSAALTVLTFLAAHWLRRVESSKRL
jgi:hypothetical protein